MIYTRKFIIVIKDGVNVFDAHERNAIIIETAINTKIYLHNYNITTAFLYEIYAKTCTQVIKEIQQAKANAPPPLKIQIEEDQDIKQYIKIIKYSLYISIIVYTIILIL